MYSLTEKYTDKVLETMKQMGKKVDYWDVRLGDSQKTRIFYRSKDLEQISFPKVFGGSVRVYGNGGWGLATFTDIDGFKKAAKQAVESAVLFKKKKVIFSPIKPVKKVILSNDGRKDFLSIKTAEKIKLLNHYRDCIWREKTALIKSNISYFDSLSKKLFISSEGSIIEQEIPRLRCSVYLTAKKNDGIQNYSKGLSFTNFKDLRDKDLRIKKAIGIVNSLVDAPPAKGGEYPVVIDGKLAGVFAHEAFGHLSEADSLINDPQLKKMMVKGSRFGNKNITIFDDPNAGSWGGYDYDDEGISPQKVILLNRGILQGRLHTRETAAILDEEPNGHGRAGDVRSIPYPRMGTTCIKNGTLSQKDLISDIKHGYYCLGFMAGMTDYGNFTFTAMYGYEIVKGELKQMVRDIKISGNLFKTLNEIEGVGKDLEEVPGMCGKWGQTIPAGTIAPSLKLGKVLIMGV